MREKLTYPVLLGPKKKIKVKTFYSEIINLQFGKNAVYCYVFKTIL